MYSQQEVKRLVLELCADLASLFPQSPIEPILFGSYARGDADSGSDIDVMCLVDASRKDISEKSWMIGDIAADFLLNYGVVLSPIVESKDYFTANASLLPFYKNVISEGVRIYA